MKDTEYAYAVAHIRAYEDMLLSDGDLEQMIAAPDVQTALKHLADKGWTGEDKKSIRDILNGRLCDAYALVKESAPDKDAIEILTVRNDFNNLKAALKSLAADIDPTDCYIYPTTLDLNALKKLLAEKRYGELPEGMSYVAKKAYDILVRSMDGQRCDICVDKFTLRHMQKIAEKTDNELVSEYVSAFVALTDIKTAYRCTKTGKERDFIYDAICGGSELDKLELIDAAANGTNELLAYISSHGYEDAASKLAEGIEAFEKYADDKLTQITDAAKYSSFGVGPLMAYYLAMETSVKCARIILECKAMNVDEKTIRERMREMYV